MNEPMKYVTMMIELSRNGSALAWSGTITAVVTVEEYRRTMAKYLALGDVPIMVPREDGEPIAFVPSKAIALHCGPERDAP